MTREAFAAMRNEDAGVSSGRGENGNGDRDYFTPLWRTKGAKSFAKTVENEGFVPLRKVV